jgi:hypothetical protein
MLAGIIAGSIISTAEGEIPFEYLTLGDNVVTRDSGTVTLLVTSVHRISAQAVTIKAGSVEHTRPDHNVIIPAEQNLLAHGWRAQSMFSKAQTIVQAEDLIDGEFITDMGARDLYLAHMTFDRQHIIYADGLEISVRLAKGLSAIAA